MQQRAKNTKEKILQAALKLFSQRGYHGATADQIAAAAGANKQRIYAYFQSKKRLFETCLLTVFEQANTQEELLLSLTEGDIPSMTTRILDSYLDIHARHPEFWRMIAWANLEPEPFHQCLANIKERSFAHLRQLYRQGQEAGQFPAATSFDAYMFTLLATSYFYHANRKTLASTLPSELFSPANRARFIAETASLLGAATDKG